MKTIGAIASTIPDANLGTIPGLDPSQRIAHNEEARRVLGEALDSGADPRSLVVHVQPDGVTCVDREALAALYRRAGVRDLASKLRRALVPSGCVLVLVDSDGATHLTTATLASFLVRPRATSAAHQVGA